MRKLLNISSRFVGRPLARRGSILIMVVAVLVLLALMGTAYISTARLDRYSALQVSQSNEQVVLEALIGTVQTSTEDALKKDLVPELPVGAPYRDAGSLIYDNYDYAGSNWMNPAAAPNTYQWLDRNDAFLASRIPQEITVTNANILYPSKPANSRLWAWYSLTRPLNQPALPLSGAAQKLFASPYQDAAIDPTSFPTGHFFSTYPQYSQDQPTGTWQFIPDQLTIVYPASYQNATLAGKTRAFPALVAYDASNQQILAGPGGRPAKFLAGDADGDGIADSGLYKIADIGGIAYYAAVRIIDHGSAINVNTAWSRQGDYSTASQVAPNIASSFLFPSSVGLMELLPSYNNATRTAAELSYRNAADPAAEDSINEYRFNVIADGQSRAPLVQTPIEEDDLSGNTMPRTDVAYGSQFEAHFFALTARWNNPGFRIVGAPSATEPDPRAYKVFKAQDNLDLLYRSGFMNPADVTPRGTLDLVMSRLALTGPGDHLDGIYEATPNYTPGPPPSDPAGSQAAVDRRFKFFPATEAEYWYRISHDFDTATRSGFTGPAGFGTTQAPTMPIRSLLTVHNAVSNLIPANIAPRGNVPHDAMLPYGARGRWNLAYQYNRGDVVYHAMPGSGVTKLYMATAASVNTMPPGGNWVEMVPRGEWNGSPTPAYQAGSVVRVWSPAPAPGSWRIYIAAAAPGGTDPNLAGGPWLDVPQFAAPPRASLNTAPFPELFRAFWNVMSSVPLGPQGGTPFDAPMNAAAGAYSGYVNAVGSNPATFNNPYVGMQFYDQLGDISVTPVVPFAPRGIDAQATPLPANNPLRMLRSPLRSVPDSALADGYGAATRRLTPEGVMMLRAAIAAVNAIDMRDADNDVTAQKISVPMVSGANRINCDAVVYGTEAQPYITEIYANTDTHATSDDVGAAVNPGGYVAIELHNPYPFDIPLTNWRLVILNRLPLGNPQLTAGPDIPLDDPATPGLTQVLVTFDATTYPGGIPVVPAHGYLLLENYGSTASIPADAGLDPLATAAYRPGGSGLPSVGPIPNALPGFTPSTSAAPAAPPNFPQLNRAYLPLPPAAVKGTVNVTAGTHWDTIFNQEVVFMKPRRFDGNYTGALADPIEAQKIGYTNDDPAGGSGYIRDFVPVDSFDFTGLILPDYPDMTGAPVTRAASWHYMRASNTDGSEPGGTRAWHFVYPGRYDATNTLVTTSNPIVRARQAGTREISWAMDSERDPWDKNNQAHYPVPFPPPTLRTLVPEMSFGVTYGSPAPETAAAGIPTYPTSFPLQLANNNFIRGGTPAESGGSIGHYAMTAASPTYRFPFGGFSRTGDVLYVPYIGAYRITINDPSAPTPLAGSIVELNSVTMDAAMAEDTYTPGDPRYSAVVTGVVGEGVPTDTMARTEYVEQIGRFCPPAVLSTISNPSSLNTTLTSYDWANDVLDYFTAINNYHDDFMPNVDPARFPGGTAPQAITQTRNMPANTDRDWDRGSQGLININTASWKVLSMLPLVVGPNGQFLDAPNQELAQAIVYYRDVDDGSGKPHGAFKTLFELNDVPSHLIPANGFWNMMGEISDTGPDPDDGQGDFTPHAAIPAPPGPAYTPPAGLPPTDGVRLDFEERNLNLIRLSNLLTTRSDVFTAYILVQGWKEVNTDAPELVAERRSAVLIDRSRLSSTNTTVETLTAPSR